MKYTILLMLLFVSLIGALDVQVDKTGEVKKIGNVAISVDDAGVLQYVKTDMADLSVDQRNAIGLYLGTDEYKNRKYVLCGKRDVGSFLLLVLREIGVDDGGLDLVYSGEEKRIIGWYQGGYKG